MLEAILVADIGSYATPITMTYTVIEKVISKEPKAPSALPKEKKAKFDKMAKEDWIKDDPYADMWDKNWISAIEPTQTIELKPIVVKPDVINKPPKVVKKVVKKKIKHDKKTK